MCILKQINTTCMAHCLAVHRYDYNEISVYIIYIIYGVFYRVLDTCII